MFAVRSFAILFAAVFLTSAFGAENSTVPVAAPSSNTTTVSSNSSSSSEVTEIPKSESPVPEEKSESPTRPPAMDVSTITPALVRDVSSTPMPSGPNQPKNQTQAASASVSPKKEGKSGASVVNAGAVVVGVAVLLTSVGFSWKL